MNQVLQNLPEVVLVGVLVTIFLWLANRDRTPRMQLWLAAWVAVLLHFVVLMVDGHIPDALSSFLSVATLLLAGVLFLVSLTSFVEDFRLSVAMFLVCGLPVIVYAAAWALDDSSRTLYLAAVLTFFLGRFALTSSLANRRKSLEVLLWETPFLLWAFYAVLHHDFDGGINAILAAIFMVCGFLFVRRIPRISPGVIAASGGFIAWGLVFPVSYLLDVYAPGVHVPGSIWNVPKIIVALGMIMTLFEDESRRALAAAKRHRDLFDHNLAGVFRSTLDGRILECNDAFVHMFGCGSLEETLNINATEMYTDTDGRTGLLRKLQQQGYLRNHEGQFRRKNGESFWALENVSLVDDGSGGKIIEGTLFDVSDRKLLETQLREAQKMEAVGQLAGGVAHDFNNVLMIISSYAELLGERIGGSPELSRYTTEIQRGTERAAALTRHLLAFSRRQVLEPKVIDLNAVLLDVSNILPRLIGEDIEFSLNLAPDLWTVKADAVQIEQVIMNLANNARDAMPNGGLLRVESQNLTVGIGSTVLTGLAPGDYVLLSVSDNGQGIPADVLPHIFEPFFTTKELGKGTGLGLSSVYGIVKQSGGDIRVDSKPGVGTTFHIFLPRSTEALPPLAGESASTVPSGARETILLVEDQSEIRDFLSSAFQSLGYNVLSASDANVAIEVFRQHEDEIDLLLTDVIMPGMNGYELASLLVNANPSLQVIYMTGYADPESISEDAATGHAILHKPFTLQAAAEYIRNALHGK